MLEAMRLGVNGVVLKEMAPRLLVQCIRKVHAGEQWIEKRSLLDAMPRREAGVREAANELTPREIQLIRMVAEGLRNKEGGSFRFGSLQRNQRRHRKPRPS